MNLFVVRHGIAIDRGAPGCPADPERYLTEEGIEKTKAVAKGVAALDIAPDAFLSSPYVRAMQTAELFAAALEFPKSKIRKTEALLPGSDPLILFRELARDKQASTVFLFGHAPQLDEVIAYALGSKHTFTALKKAGVSHLELKRIAPPQGTLLWLCPPKLLKRSGKNG